MMTTTRPTFTVTAERGRSGVWVLESDNGAVSQVRRLDQAESEMREAIAYLSGLASDSFDIAVMPVLPTAYLEAEAEAERLAQAAAEAKTMAARASRAAAHALRDTGMSLREVGTIMGVSYQRAAQLVGD